MGQAKLNDMLLRAHIYSYAWRVKEVWEWSKSRLRKGFYLGRRRSAGGTSTIFIIVWLFFLTEVANKRYWLFLVTF